MWLILANLNEFVKSYSCQYWGVAIVLLKDRFTMYEIHTNKPPCKIVSVRSGWKKQGKLRINQRRPIRCYYYIIHIKNRLHQLTVNRHFVFMFVLCLFLLLKGHEGQLSPVLCFCPTHINQAQEAMTKHVVLELLCTQIH